MLTNRAPDLLTRLGGVHKEGTGLHPDDVR
jgi:hypothetical protein